MKILTGGLNGVAYRYRCTNDRYSRGLNVSKGVWEEDSVYGTRGGFIAFLDGHAEFFSDLHHKLVNFRTLQPTSQIQEAVPSQAHAYGTSGRIW